MTVFFKRKPTKEEQIEILRGGSAIKTRNLFRECIDFEKTPHKTIEDLDNYYKAFYIITKSEILTYIKENYSLKDLGMYDNKCYLKLKKEKGKYVIYTWDYEYEMRTGKVIDLREEFYDTEDEVYERYVRFLIGSSGTGLTFEDKKDNS